MITGGAILTTGGVLLLALVIFLIWYATGKANQATNEHRQVAEVFWVSTALAFPVTVFIGSFFLPI